MVINYGTIKSLNNYLNLPATGNEQDWELELADRSRLSEFIDFLVKMPLEQQEKYALFSLIIVSYDDFLLYENDDELEIWNKIVDIIHQDKILYIDVFNYWALWNETSSNDLFKVTPLIRNYLANNM